MTSPLVKAAAGYITLSRLDNSRSRPSICTANRFDSAIVFLHTFRRRLVGAQPQETRKPQPPVGGAIAIADLDHQIRTYPVRPSGILAGNSPGRERRIADRQRRQRGEQFLLRRRADAAPDPPPKGD